MPPIRKTQEEITRELIDEAAKKTAQETAEAVKKSMMENGMGGSKISKILKDIKEPEDIEKKKAEDLEKKKAEEHVHDNEVFCPTCTGKEHKHILKEVGKGKVKCSGEDCGTIYNLIPEGYLDKAGYECKDCGKPHVRVETESESDKCLFCGTGTEFIKTSKFNVYKSPKK